MVAGRNCLDDLKLGDTLQLKAPDGQLTGRQFVILEMEMYNRSVKEVPGGYTAGLFFTNNHASSVALGAELVGKAF